ncbi:NAD-dependent protein deacetylase, SIR2 family [Ruminococcus sp. YE71]|uniref:SIR2 family NAD-dependent protein deacylase n=1 Tax=unclassified Ruminococcus TaxID=2608920 RepID=UPI0008894407|nr:MULTISPECIES: Sir2 silent information regulator family NAD-dependent deacetylase [unclassified Ruminococcus]SDA31999.1 NAD-dependent protein deacetylase, SIR2 family [Ruminococcus sp. YE78]SFW52761.1 NAD-dependent protein deacetylase, SIR2 family [Ruminococcus sp. YE71]
MRYTRNYSDELDRLKKEIASADCIIIGAGAGLSTAAGFTYSGERFEKFFSDFEAKYGFHDMYSGGFYPFETPEEMWAYWSRFIYCNRYMDVDNGTYKQLFELVKDMDYFVITTNVDHQFQKSGFDKKRLFYTQGDYGLFQCSEPCHDQTYDNETQVKDMIEFQEDMKIPTELIPKCPKCGKPMTMNLRSDDKFVEDEGWHRAAERYEDFLQAHEGQHILFLELGVGYNTPVIIKYPFWKISVQNPNAVYACLNFGEAYAPDEIKEQSVLINGDIHEVLKKLA